MTVCSRAGADVLGTLVHPPRDLRDACDPALRELDPHLLGPHQGRVLRGERCIGLGQDPDEVLGPQGVELDPDGEAPLQLGDEVGGAGDVERTGRDEEDVVGAHHAVAGVHGAALHQRQEVALHPLAGDVRPLVLAAAGHLVDLVEEHDRVLLGLAERPRLELLVVDELRGLLLREEPHRLLHRHRTGPGAARPQVLEQPLELAGHLLHAGGGP